MAYRHLQKQFYISPASQLMRVSFWTSSLVPYYTPKGGIAGSLGTEEKTDTDFTSGCWSTVMSGRVSLDRVQSFEWLLELIYWCLDHFSEI